MEQNIGQNNQGERMIPVEIWDWQAVEVSVKTQKEAKGNDTETMRRVEKHVRVTTENAPLITWYCRYNGDVNASWEPGASVSVDGGCSDPGHCTVHPDADIVWDDEEHFVGFAQMDPKVWATVKTTKTGYLLTRAEKWAAEKFPDGDICYEENKTGNYYIVQSWDKVPDDVILRLPESISYLAEKEMQTMTEAKLEKSRRLYSQLEALDWKKYLEVPEELSEKGIRGVDLRMSYARNGYLDSWRYTIDHAFERDTKEYGVEKLRIGHYKLYFSNLHNCFSITVQRRQTDGKEIEMSLWVGKRSEELVICEPCNVLSDTERQAFFEPDDFDYICEFVEAISEVAPKIREYVLDGCKKKLG